MCKWNAKKYQGSCNTSTYSIHAVDTTISIETCLKKSRLRLTKAVHQI